MNDINLLTWSQLKTLFGERLAAHYGSEWPVEMNDDEMIDLLGVGENPDHPFDLHVELQPGEIYRTRFDLMSQDEAILHIAHVIGYARKGDDDNDDEILGYEVL